MPLWKVALKSKLMIQIHQNMAENGPKETLLMIHIVNSLYFPEISV